MITLCSSVRRWSVTLLVKWVWQVGHQCFCSSLFSLESRQTWIIKTFWFSKAVFSFKPHKWRFPLTRLTGIHTISSLTDPSLLVPCRDSCTLGRRVTRHALLMCWISIMRCWWETLFMWLRKFCKNTEESKGEHVLLRTVDLYMRRTCWLWQVMLQR